MVYTVRFSFKKVIMKNILYHLANKTLYNVVCMLLQLGHPVWTLYSLPVAILG